MKGVKDVTKIELYQCDICKMRWDDLKSAMNCAARGPAPEYPIGCIYGDSREGSMYSEITFAVATNRLEGHANTGASWACRDSGYGDSLGESMCSGPSLHLTESHKHVDPSTPHFIRMVGWLRSQRQNITVWDGKKWVYYATFLRRFKKGDWY
jgi:hypothetical protein